MLDYKSQRVCISKINNQTTAPLTTTFSPKGMTGEVGIPKQPSSATTCLDQYLINVLACLFHLRNGKTGKRGLSGCNYTSTFLF